MVLFPHCKINLGLTILRRREDGYHDLETVFYPLPVKDVLEIIPSERLSLSSSGLPIPGELEANLCIKAFHLLQKDFPHLPPVGIYLHKNIPMGAGLGGGSADGAFMLRLLNKCFHLNLSQKDLLVYAARLGSDCPFFILEGPCLGEGRGELLQPLELDLSGYSFVLVNPGVHIGTAWAFSQITPGSSGKPVKAIIRQPLESWRGELVNDFEEPVFRQHPLLRSIKEQLYDQGALYASLTGSGSSIFGIFKKGTAGSVKFAGDTPAVLLA